MNHSSYSRRNRINRSQFTVEQLECRWVLSLGISTIPADGTSLALAPSSIEFRFDQPIPAEFWTSWNLELDRLDGDSLTPLSSLDPPIDRPDLVQTQSIPLPALDPGHYRVVLNLRSDLASVLDLYADSGVETIADFTVLPPAPRGTTLSDAVDVGVLGTDVRQISQTLDLTGGRNTVDLYEFSVPEGHSWWRLGVQLDAQRIGSGLLADLALFDHDGNLLATRLIGSGRPDFPNDPYLFTGLATGRYYLGVSGSGNVPGLPGGYDPVTGTLGTTGVSQSGGRYQLQFVADAADSPTKLLGFELLRADPLSGSPTGLTLAFSGPLDLATLVRSDGNHPVVLLVDQSGQSWPITPSGYQESTGELSFVFNQSLPAGRYTLNVPAVGGLRDLAGRSPVADGLPSGVLARWTVAPGSRPSSDHDLGVIWAGIDAGARQFTTILPGNTAIYRFVVPAGGLYKLQTVLKHGELTIQRLSRDGVVLLNGGTGTPLWDYDMNLNEGVYFLSFHASGRQPVQLEWTLKSLQTNLESLINNGVGQGAALALRLINPTSWAPSQSGSVGMAMSLSEAAASQVPSSTQATSNSPSAGNTPALSFVSSVPSSLLVTVNSGLMGRPTEDVSSVPVVGTALPVGYVATVDRTAGLLPGIFSRSGEIGEQSIRLTAHRRAGLVVRPGTSPTPLRIAKSPAETSLWISCP